ncbi:hypothetical protein KKF05_00225 [Patescibacteria group bacterium]|nr:hypothetical protein [Patescibacteria group bacterium]MBU1028837.1 hypothetical protein [Patescibacteria group bacterium]MBU1915876.1 hypothetical protein [Patescibacteria group bacterium]
MFVVGLIARIIAFIFLLFNTIIFLSVAIKSIFDIIHRVTNTGLSLSILFLLASFALGIWLLGLMQQVLAANWPQRAVKIIQKKWFFGFFTILLFEGLFFLFKTPVHFYASIGHNIGLSFAQLAMEQFGSMLKIALPIDFIRQIVAWEFQLFYASFIVGFLVWVWQTISRKSAWSELEQSMSKQSKPKQ